MDVWQEAPERNQQAPQQGIDSMWAESRLVEYLNELHNLPQHNVHKPASPFFVVLLKIGSLVKSSHLNYGAVLQQIQIVYAKRGLSEKDISYQFKRAYQRCTPLVRGAC